MGYIFRVFHRSFHLGLVLLPACLALAACIDDGGDEAGDDDVGHSDGGGDGEDTSGEGFSIPEFGSELTIIGTEADGLNAPRDLEFNPANTGELWTFNMLSHGTVIYFEPGTDAQNAEVRIDTYGAHFMAFVSSGAFGDNGNFATCHESRDEWNVGPQEPDDFMGPTLWPADLSIYAMVGQDYPPGAQEGSHLDMLHQSPLCMGIAHEAANAYWAYDGFNGNLVRYDFLTDHGPGGSDHTDATIRRFTDASVTRVSNVVSHLEFDHDTGLLYLADTGTGRIMRFDPSSATMTGNLPNNWDGATEYTGWAGGDYEVLAEGFDEPSGLALHEGRLFVTEHGSGDIVALDLDGDELDRMGTDAVRIMGITVGPEGKLWYADPGANEIIRVEPD